jgi:hypothetical protein
VKGARISYSADELAWIKACSDMPRIELHALFVQIYCRTDVTCDHIKALCSRHGWTAGPEGRRRSAGKSLIFTPDQVAWLHANASLPRDQVEAAFRAAFPGTTTTRAQIVGWRKNHKVTTGRTGRFEKGQVPPNKGRKGYCPPGCEKGWFKPGVRQGVATKLYQPIGTERVSKDGYRERKVNDDLPLQARWRAVHLVEWEAVNGPLPKGHALKCLDGDKTNTAPSNWEAIPRAILPRLNGRFGRGYDAAPSELKPTLLAIAKLEHRAREAGKAKP